MRIQSHLEGVGEENEGRRKSKGKKSRICDENHKGEGGKITRQEKVSEVV